MMTLEDLEKAVRGMGENASGFKRRNSELENKMNVELDRLKRDYEGKKKRILDTYNKMFVDLRAEYEG